MSLLGSVLLYLVAPLTAVLAFLHLAAIREEAEKKKKKFNADYKPEETDCTVELSFTKPGVDRVSLSLGLCSLSTSLDSDYQIVFQGRSSC